MKVLVITGSPHSRGTTALLADEFCVGAKDAGHEVIRFETAKLNVHPCLGCYHCRDNDGSCVYDDDMTHVYPHLLTSEVVVLVTPLYYFGMTAQLKRVIDRFFAINPRLRKTPKGLYLIAACGDKDNWAMDALLVHFQTLCRYLHWQEGGKVLAIGAYTREDLKDSDYLMRAKNLGREL
ncbi:NADPH-dependent FMN reductase [Desulfosporosinus orientis DSM 765]|uniref:NADPH-dependent FMN reductase n=1 Tax=Desulfosporosinus orientis (strain ATCC 19365 / DSM 765 / NCIMB 8382 / VKM B-1628 / Singapore I) TaxID=768706 RepID=G7WAR4_DESOD|nr:flavodoxin family protein [Desulfosporosinus orientis]AET67125.1 NADPH-dependent FMN reductase [Desulfosporosinus orientis DSM 765]